MPARPSRRPCSGSEEQRQQRQAQHKTPNRKDPGHAQRRLLPHRQAVCAARPTHRARGQQRPCAHRSLAWYRQARPRHRGLNLTLRPGQPGRPVNCEDESGNPMGYPRDRPAVGNKGKAVGGPATRRRDQRRRRDGDQHSASSASSTTRSGTASGARCTCTRTNCIRPPPQADWTADDGTLGWAAYKVADDVARTLWATGSYLQAGTSPPSSPARRL